MVKQTWFGACVVVAGLVPFARADRFDPARVAAGARWVAHVDVEALAASELHAALAEDGELRLEDEVEELKELGLEPLKDLRSVTVYSVDPRSEHAVVLLVGNANVDGALERLKGREGYREERVEGQPVHVWGGDGGAWYAAVLRREGSQDRLVVQSDDRASLVLACGVLEGRAEHLAVGEDPAATTGAVLRARPEEGSILFAAATTRLAELPGLELASNVVKLADDVVFDLGEARGELFARLRVDARTEKEARQVQQVLQGAAALLALVGGEDPEVGRVVQDLSGALRFTTAGAEVHAEFRMPTRRLIDDLRALDAAGADAPAPARPGGTKK